MDEGTSCSLSEDCYMRTSRNLLWLWKQKREVCRRTVNSDGVERELKTRPRKAHWVWTFTNLFTTQRRKWKFYVWLPGMAARIYNPRPQEVETEGLQWICGYPGLYIMRPCLRKSVHKTTNQWMEFPSGIACLRHCISHSRFSGFRREPGFSSFIWVSERGGEKKTFQKKLKSGIQKKPFAAPLARSHLPPPFIPPSLPSILSFLPPSLLCCNQLSYCSILLWVESCG